MGFLRYLRSRLWELALLALASSALAYTACSAFYATQPFQAEPWLIALPCAALSAALVCVAYSRRTALWGGIAIAVVCIAAVIACVAASPYELPLEDAEGNLVFLVLVVVLCAVAAFLLSRTLPGSFALLVGGAYLSALVEFLYWYGHVVALCLFVAAAIGLIACCGYRRAVRGSDEGTVAFAPVALAAIALACVAALAGAGVFYGVIAPLDPPRQEVKLIVENRRLDEVLIFGTGSSVNDETGEGGSLAGTDEEVGGEDADVEWYDVFQSGVRDLLGMDDDQTGDEGTTTMLERISYLALIVAGIVVALILAAIAAKKGLRRRRYNRMTSGDSETAASNLYLFFLDRMEKMKVARPDAMGLAEFARDFAPTFKAFEGDAQSDEEPAFTALTDVYMRTAYGKGTVSDDELRSFKDYYQSFYKNARRRIGGVRYLFKFFKM